MSSKPTKISPDMMGSFNYIINTNGKNDIDYVKVILDDVTIHHSNLETFSYNVLHGLHSIEISAIDKIGNESNILVWDWLVYNMNANFDIFTPSISGNDVAVTISYDPDFSNITYSLYNDTLNSLEISGSAIDTLNFNLNDANYTLTYFYDIVVNSVYITSLTQSVSWVIDTTPPNSIITTKVLSSYEIAYPNNNLTISASGSEINCMFSFGLNGIWSSFNSSNYITYTNIQDGSYTVSVKAKDIYDNIQSTNIDSKSFTYISSPIINSFSVQPVYFTNSISGINITNNSLVTDFLITETNSVPDVNNISWGTKPTSFIASLAD